MQSLSVNSRLNFELKPNIGATRIWHSVDTWRLKLIENDVETTILQFSLTDSATGCGVQLLYGLTITGFDSCVNEKDLKDIINAINIVKKNDGVGCIICTLGDAHLSKESVLLKLGFKELDYYNNWQHGLKYKQKLYNLIIK